MQPEWSKWEKKFIWKKLKFMMRRSGKNRILMRGGSTKYEYKSINDYKLENL
jgi:hypothetical protein